MKNVAVCHDDALAHWLVILAHHHKHPTPCPLQHKPPFVAVLAGAAENGRKPGCLARCAELLQERVIELAHLGKSRHTKKKNKTVVCVVYMYVYVHACCA